MIFIKFFIEFGQLFEKFSPCDMLGENGKLMGTPCRVVVQDIYDL